MGMNALQKEAQLVHDACIHNGYTQFIAVDELSNHAKEELENDTRVLGFPFRLKREGNRAIIKFTPFPIHDWLIQTVKAQISAELSSMGLMERLLSEHGWGHTKASQGNDDNARVCSLTNAFTHPGGSRTGNRLGGRH
jgi:hypothetical protein